MTIPSTVITYLFLIPLGLLGGITSYTDIRYGKIKNIHLLLGLIYSICLYSFLIVYSTYGIHQPGNLKYLFNLFLNGSFAFLCGYLLWRFDLWAAGDAKLFSLFAFLIPLEFYSRSYISLFPSATLLIDAFLFICSAFIVEMLCKLTLSLYGIARSFLRKIKEGFRLSFSDFFRMRWGVLKSFIIETGKLFLLCTSALIAIEGLSIFLKKIIPSANISHPLLFQTFFFALQIILFRSLWKNKIFVRLILVAGAVCGTTFLLSHNGILLLNRVKNSIILLLLVGVVMQMVYTYIESHETRRIRAKDVCLGSFITPESLLYIENEFKKKNKADELGTCCSDGLTRIQADLIRDVFENDDSIRINVYKTFFFAPFIFLAFLFTILTKGSFLFFLLDL